VHQFEGGDPSLSRGGCPSSQSRWRGGCFVFDQRVGAESRARARQPTALCYCCAAAPLAADRQGKAQLRGRVSCHPLQSAIQQRDCLASRATHARFSLARGRGGEKPTSVLQLGRWIPQASSSVRKLALLRSASMTFLGTLIAQEFWWIHLDGRAMGNTKVSSRMFIFGGPDTNLRLNWCRSAEANAMFGDPAERAAVSRFVQRLLPRGECQRLRCLVEFSPAPLTRSAPGWP